MTLELIRRFKWNCRLLMKRASSSIPSPLENSFIILCGEDRNVIYLEFQPFLLGCLDSLIDTRLRSRIRVNFSFPSVLPSSVFFSSSSFFYDWENCQKFRKDISYQIREFLIKKKKSIDNSQCVLKNRMKINHHRDSMLSHARSILSPPPSFLVSRN